jgi:hypothetical protein
VEADLLLSSVEATVQAVADRHIALRVTCRTSGRLLSPPLKVSNA